jgi:predicted negative regulator of RcsB-dependent stress response
MDVHASEKEQIETLRKWWKENGSSVITGVLLGLAVLFGGKAWFNYQDTQSQNASNIYVQLLGALSRDEREQVTNSANELIGNYSGSVYAPLAAMMLARLAVADGELEAARAQLQWALEHADALPVQHTARMRLVRVLIDQQAFADAAATLAAVQSPGAFAYLYAELEGDLAMAQGDSEKAARAYKRALDGMPVQAANQALLSAKYENVAGAGDTSQ